MSTKGFGAQEVEEAYSRAHLLSRQVEVTTLLGPVLCGLWNFYLTRANFQQAQELAEQLMTLAQKQPEAVMQLQAHNARGQTHLFMGEPAAAQVHIAQGLRLYNLSAHRHLATVYGEDPGVVCHKYAALARWLLGYPAQAARHLDQGMQLAQELGSPFGIAQILWGAAVVAQGGRDLRRVDNHTHALVTLCREEGIEIWLAGGSILQGWARAYQGQAEEGIALIRQGVNELRAGGGELARPHALALLAEAYGSAGQPNEGLCELTEALAIVDATGERWWEAELWRIKGELLLQQQSQNAQACPERSRRVKAQKAKPGIKNWELGSGPLPSPSPNPQSQIPDPASETEECFLKAIDIVRQQQAKSLELRAVTSLVRLRRQQATDPGSRSTLTEAHQMLSEIYNWFTEGFETKDLQEAKTLLDSLESGV